LYGRLLDVPLSPIGERVRVRATHNAFDSPHPCLRARPSPPRNGTAINGLAKKVADQLTKEGYKVIATGNAKSKTIEKTNVYAPKVTQADDAQKIATQLVATAQTDFPEDEAKTTADILIILGADAAK